MQGDHERIRIAHVVVSDRAWGIVKVALELARQQSKSSSVWMAMNSDLLAGTVLPERVLPVPLPLRIGKDWPTLPKQILMAADFARAGRTLEKANREFSWDVVHFHLPNAYFLSLLTTNRMNKVFTVHGRLFESPLLRRFERPLAKAVVRNSPTSTISQNATAYLPKRSDVYFIPNGVDAQRVTALSEAFRVRNEEIFGSEEEKRPLLVFPASLIRRKGQDLLLQSMEKIRATHATATALLIGAGPDEVFLRGLAREARVEDSVIFMGYADNVYPYMRTADVVLSHLSLRWPFPSLVELEALSLGKPVITRYTAEKYSLYRDAVYYLRSEDPGSLAAAVEAALSSDDASMAAARRKAAEKLSWESVSTKYRGMYDASLGKRTAREEK